MKLIKTIYIIFCLFIFVAIGCSKSEGNNDNPPPIDGTDDEPMIPDPSAATLVFPEDNSECNTGIVDSNDETVSTVTFEWNESQNTDSYTVTVTNLNTGSATFTNTTAASVDITISRGVPYEWFVTSRADGTTVTSDSEAFRFYNEGPGIENYAPFPAVAINPARGANLDASTSSVDLQWEASDIDNDIRDFDVLFGTENDPANSIGTSSETTILDVPVATGNTYFWRVITFDEFGNSSTSEIFEFRIN